MALDNFFVDLHYGLFQMDSEGGCQEIQKSLQIPFKIHQEESVQMFGLP